MGMIVPRNRNTDAPNNPKRPSDASRNAKVSTPASVMGTSAKDFVGNEYEAPEARRRKVPGSTASDPIRRDSCADLDGIEVGSHSRTLGGYAVWSLEDRVMAG